ncbi:Peptidoglycan/xylan/chitin deacetylase, PgdA/CDA1 family [Nakamurella panacisegetis]|uniref:Peptidoglycan/xylan/chitin deacetylase, PgdA/CDA1 family n=1 Tax=Nakamurella panacisegetis TaxID=1090615 RepID=A0A1H0IXG5_9ACTN|nr:polysaccharide deacetylase family protein [Nakamurella panacisegetis]SDO35761.1 Peptidoglycan/xylan/chitin deacetylase, PgdA/CDA1 family [Nakamurella panacisegetis]
MADRRRGRWLSALGAAAAAGYWAMFSSYSQMICDFPFRARPVDDRVIALTFDDGPNEPFTSQIADFLHEQDITATFFQVGRCVERHPGVTARMIDQGHVIGNHSWSHQMTRCIRPGAQRVETARTQALLTEAIGRVPMLYRPPWLLRTPTLPRVLRGEGLQPISGVFCHAFEVFQPSARRIARRALAKARPGAILIFHDGFDGRGGDRTNTVGAVKIVVRELRRQGYRFATVDELLGVPAYRAEEKANG